MKPASIVMFGRCYVASWAIGLVNTLLAWRGAAAIIARNPQARAMPALGPSVLVIGVAIGALVTFTLWYFVTQRASAVAKWLVTAFFAFSLVSFLASLASGKGATTGLPIIIGVAGLVLEAVAVWMLFKPDAKRWFDERASAR